ncbi:MSHA biogenesis protein MshK [Undibacterium sp. Jales W-56]|uniref:MSHA biogenesis protein MshK n=1 Tax=Undibacterium sp. Jales W-56 TaxID=2897325 RepID=UPI0021D0EDDC|nr:MSHA biogenesis protein MshK [Undibacterium sp. Jales W-56]MCU6432702.1 MSHA biogenesis protein MshK [Undibacterium sp. Jales W-56]
MAQFMTQARCVNRSLAKSWLALTLLAFPILASAQPIPDPTRPPDILLLPSSPNNEIAAGPVLQTVLIAPHRRLAIINGKTLGLNEKFEDQTVVKITDTEVILRRGKELQILKLFPDFEKKPQRASGNISTNAKK